MQLSMTTDYARDTGDPAPYLRRIAEAGFSHVHWCHQWCTDYLYSEDEIEQIRRLLGEFQLSLLDLHASAGKERSWTSPDEDRRSTGVELIQNRIAMAERLESDVIIVHVRGAAENAGVRRSLDQLEPFARARGVRIAVENTGNFDIVEPLLLSYDSGYLGLCYDSGHGNLTQTGLDSVERLKDRLISVHLHDNDGSGDQHRLPFTGSVDWSRLARIIAGSAYSKPVSMEVTMALSGIADEDDFLTQAFTAGVRLTAMIDQVRT